MRTFIALVCVFFALVDVTNVQASSFAEQNYQSAEASLQCELHIWPAERLEGIEYWLYPGAIHGRASSQQIKGAMTDLVNPSAQVAALREANVVNELGLVARTRVIEHQEPLDRKSLNKIKARRAKSSSPCYSELIMMQHTLAEDIFWGDRFLSVFMFRDFGAETKVKNTVKGRGGSKLKILTLATDARPANSSQLASAALRANFLEFIKSTKLGSRTRSINAH